MIPLRLSLKNFMCYGDDAPELDLQGVHVACLCGDNGHGKTALLDAMTWALWGQARARTQDELVHQGQRDMAVELDFEARGQRYRVSRKYSRSARAKQGQSMLDLFVVSDNGLVGISGDTMRETGEKVREILHLDYETFINTAFLRQGDADRFTTSRPSERKSTLAEVLDLSYYDALEERAKARSRAIHERVVRLDGEIALKRQEMGRRGEYEEQVASVSESLKTLIPEAEAQRLRVEEARSAVDSLRANRFEVEELGRRLAQGQQELSDLERQAQSYEARVGEYEAALDREAEIRQAFAGLREVREELERLDAALARKGEVDRRKADLEREIAVQAERLSSQVEQLRRRLAQDLEPKAKRLPEIEQGRRALVEEQAKLVELEADVGERHGEAREIAASVRLLEEANAVLRREMEEARGKFDMLEQGDTSCPLCGQPLGPEGQEHLRREYEAQGLDRKRRYQENSAQHKGLSKRSEEIASRLSRLEDQLSEERQRVEVKAANLERDRFESLEAQAEATTVAVELAQTEAVIRAEGFAYDQREMLAKVDAELSALGYDADAHQLARARRRELEPYDELHRRLQEAAERLPSERDALVKSREMLERRRKDVGDVTERKAAIEGELKALPSLEIEHQEAESRFQEVSGQREKALVEQGVLVRQIERCNVLTAEVGKQEQERSQLANDKATYDELASAFGKNGVQALIIESAIPQLEADANEVLGRLTDNRMFLRLQLQEGRRDSRTGQPSEELDLRIADEVGTRSYELFSGGEAFRINFALRIALSRLLARRSGAPLPTLFIDEGFGSQDTEGQERLTQAIQSIQEDFDKIIVITHVDRIKEAFPVRIEVSKVGGRSSFELV